MGWGGFPGGPAVKNQRICLPMQETQETWVWSLSQEKFSGVGNGNPAQVFLAGKFHGQRSLAGYSPWVHKESDTAEQLSMHIEEGKGFGHCISPTFSVVGIIQIFNILFLCVPNLI